MTTDLTKGNIFKLILVFTIPYLIGNLFQQFYNIADTVIVGRTLGTTALAAVGATGCLSWFSLGFIMGVCTGFSVVTARFFGSGDEAGVKKSFAMSIVLSVIMAAVMTLFCTVASRLFLEFLNTPEEIIDMSSRYIFIIFAGIPSMTMYNLLSNQIRSLGNSTAPLVFLIIASAINIALDLIFILVFNMSVEGAAYATVIAQLASGVLCVIYLVKKVPQLHLSREDFRINTGLIKNLLRIGLPMGLLNMILSLGSITLQWATNQLSTTAVATYTAACKIEQISMQPVQSFGATISVFAAQNYGAGKIRRVRKGVNSCMIMTMIWTAVATVIMLLFGRNMMAMIVGSDASPQIISDGNMYMIINTALMVFLSPVVIYKGALQSLGRALIPTISGFVEVACRAGVAFFLALNFGFIGLCFANPAAWVGALVMLLPEYFIFMKKLSEKEQANEV